MGVFVDRETGELVRASEAAPLDCLEQAAAMLAQANTVPDVAKVVNLAEAARVLARKAQLGLQAQNHAAEIKVRAERKAGQLLAEMRANGERAGRGGDPMSHGVTLQDLGVTGKQSSRWQAVASIPDDEFEMHLVAVKGRPTGEVTTSDFLKLAKRTRAADKPDVEPPSTAGVNLGEHDDPVPTEFPTIVIDPPWQYDNVATRGAAEDHYPTMTLAELAELHIPAAANAHIYLWTTNGFLREAFDLLDAWDFTYKTCLTWVKPQIGLGNWFRNSTEHVLFGVRGSLPTRRNDVPTWFQADRRRHSQKPESFYDMVESCSPGPYFEMFARRRRFGWHVWGNEA